MNVTTALDLWKPNTLWRHNKTGNIYASFGTVKDCTNATEGRELVLYAMPGCTQWYARERAEFEEKFSHVPQKDTQKAFSHALATVLLAGNKGDKAKESTVCE